jgi:hypothetical protein
MQAVRDPDKKLQQDRLAPTPLSIEDEVLVGISATTVEAGVQLRQHARAIGNTGRG